MGYGVEKKWEKNKKYNWLTWALGALVVLLLFGQGWPIVAVVNYKPIFRWQLDEAMKAQYGQQTLEQMISEQLILAEA